MPPPSGIPQNTTAVVNERFSGALTSDATATKLGSAAPNPKPTSQRTTNNVSKLPAYAVANVKTPNASTAPINTGLRPTRSANQPPKLAPITNPILLMENSQPICPGSSPNSGAMRGAATPI